MRLKTLAVSVLILAVLAAAAYYLQRPAPPLSNDARIGHALVGRATVEKAAQLRLTDQGKNVQLVRQPDGTWRVSSYFDLPADFSKLSTFVGSLTDAKVQRLVTTNPERIARLEFKDTTVELLDAAGKELWSITLGKAPDLGGGRFVRFGTEPKAYLADFSAWLDADAKNWANPQLLDLKPDTVAKIEIPFAGGPVVVSRAKKDAVWTAEKTPADQRVKAERIASLLGSIGNLRFSDTNDPADPNVTAARANLRTFKLTTFDGKTITVALGRKPEEKKLKPPATPAATSPSPAPTPASAKPAEPVGPASAKPAEEPLKTAAPKPPAPEYETIPAGPVFVFISDSDAAAPVNGMMKKRAFQLSDYIFTGLPQKPEELFEPAPVPPPPAPAPPAAKPGEKGTAGAPPSAEKKP